MNNELDPVIRQLILNKIARTNTIITIGSCVLFIFGFVFALIGWVGLTLIIWLIGIVLINEEITQLKDKVSELL